MKTTIQIAAILLFGILLTATACNKDKMPDEDKDWNVLEWTVDGERYKADCEGDPLFGCDPVDCEYYTDIKSLYITGGNYETAIVLYKYRNLNNKGLNNLEYNDFIRFADFNNSNECRRYWSDTNHVYKLNILSLDTLDKFIEGEFSFTGINDCQDTTKVTDGYFKLSYRP